MPPTVRALVIDFDGTIVDQDVSEEILEAFASREWWDIDLAFQRGEIGSRECLVRQAALLKGRREEMLRFAVERYDLDPTFAPFAAWAQELGIVVAVASDGLGFYVEPMLRAAGVDGVAVHSNTVGLEPGRPPRFAFPSGHPLCSTCGTCKMAVVLRYRASVGPVAFVGEGHTDRYGALYSDIVFAKKWLQQIAADDGVPYIAWETFDDVRAALEGTGRLPGPVAPRRCPGWSEP